MNPSSTASSSSLSESIRRTALDALGSKYSALLAGYQPIPRNSEVYREFMEAMLVETNSRDDKDRDSNHTTYSTSAVTPHPKMIKPQSPLVNAGYAMRLAAVTRVIENFVNFHQEPQQQQQQQNQEILSENLKLSKNQHLNICILGCGMDVVGLWASSLCGCARNIQIWEVDSWEIATAKRDILLQQGLVTPTSTKTSSSDNSNVILEGRIARHNNETTNADHEPHDKQLPNNYHLLAADLRHVSQLEAVLDSCQAQGPTLVLFELVLAYLGTPEIIHKILEWCAQNLLTTPTSVLVAYEALGDEDSHQQAQDKCRGVLRAYQAQYAKQFNSKLQRGRSTTKTTTITPNDNTTSKHTTTNLEIFLPLGSSPLAVESRLQTIAAFQSVHACTAGTAAYWTQRLSKHINLRLPPGQLFDEHAALQLHLASYVLVVAFAAAAANSTNATYDEDKTTNEKLSQFLLKQRLCPWHYHGTTHHVIQPGSDSQQQQQIHCYLTTVEPMDQTEVRTLFQATYQEVAAQYSAVRKMVQTALRQEFAISNGSNNSIRQSYQRLGGDFWVALDFSNTSNSRHVVGAIGVRRWNKPTPTQDSASIQDFTTTTFEIHRFFVDANYRGKGIGSALLQHAEAWVRKRQKRQPGQPQGQCRLVATTLALLEDANRLYNKHEYTLSEETSIGELQMNTYSKDVA